MAHPWIEKITGSLEEKKRYREYKERVRALPDAHRTAARGIERYLVYVGGLSDGSALIRMLGDLADLFERAAADGTPVRDVVGDDPVEFAEDFLRTYRDAQWITTERTRLTTAIAEAERQEGSA